MKVLGRIRKLEHEHEEFLHRLSSIEEEAELQAERLLRLERERGIFLPKPAPPSTEEA